MANVGASRLPSLDALRGLIVVLMALDHAVFFVARRHPLEYWGTPPPQHQDAFWMLTRLSSHICAPGFFFLLGCGMALFSASRREVGWSNGRITRHFLARGLVLLAIQQLVVNPAWFIGTFGSTAILGSAGPPGGGGMVYFNLDVLYGLGACMIAMSFLLRANGIVVAATSCAAIAATQVLTPRPEHVGTLYPPLERMLLIPGQTGILLVGYPIVPWLGVTGLGLVFGRRLLRHRDRAFRWLPAIGAASLTLFALLWGVWGVGNLRAPTGEGIADLLSLTKYPPSVAFLLFTCGVLALLLSLVARRQRPPGQRSPLLVFGSAALFFYVVHLYVYAVSGLPLPAGTGLVPTYLVWLVGLAVLYPLCAWYGAFKRRTAPDSAWRYF